MRTRLSWRVLNVSLFMYKPFPHARAFCRVRVTETLLELLRERGGCFVVGRYVFGLSTKHPVVSVREFT